VGPRVPVGGRPEGIAITPDQRFLYSNSVDANDVKSFAIGADGQLSFLGSFPTCADAQSPAACGAVSMVIAPDGRTLFVANTARRINDVVSFGIGANGALAQIAAVPTGGGGPPKQGVAIRPNQGPIAALAHGRGVVGEAIAFDASESFDPDGRIIRYDWDFGDGNTAPNGGPNLTHAYVQPGQYRATVTVTDNEGCSGTFVFTGQTALCNGSPAATSSRLVNVRRRGQ
jgi:6-phosphogluconolactonase (cycloisomerase 2 family)